MADCSRPEHMRHIEARTRTRPRRKFSARAFWLTCLILSFLALCSWWSAERNSGIIQSGSHGILQARDLGAYQSEDEQASINVWTFARTFADRELLVSAD